MYMNQKDKSNQPRLSLAPIDENPVAQQQSTVLQSGTKTVCPKCGYRAKHPNDPLVTKYQGLGECPKCGIIVQKYLEKRAKTASPQASPYARSDSTNDKPHEPISREVFLGVVFITLVGLMLLLKLSDPKTTGNNKPLTETVQASATARSPQQATADQSGDAGIKALAKLQSEYRDKMRAQDNMESSISLAETAAAEIDNAKHSLTDPKTVAAYERCQNGFRQFAWMLREQQGRNERIKSLENKITSIEKQSGEVRRDLNNQRQVAQGFNATLLYNAEVEVSGRAFIEISQLQEEILELRRENAKGGGPGSSLDETCSQTM